MNFKMILDWVRRHVFIVVFVAIIIAAPITGFFIGSSLKSGVQTTLSQKGADLTALNSLESSNVTLSIPGREPVSVRTTVNRRVIDAYGQVIEALRKDADTIREAALRHNSKDRDVFLTDVFPKPAEARRQVAHERLYPIVVEAFRNLLKEVRAGEPPNAAEVREQLTRRSATFIAAVGGKKERSELSPEDQKRHDDDMVKARKGIYAEAARNISFYATPQSIGEPAPPRNVPPTGMPLDRMFEWNWNFWITEDVVRALADANAGSENVLTAPVKRILHLYVQPVGGGGKSGPAAPQAAAGADAAPAAAPVDPRPEITRQYDHSFTGRRSNALYDVRTVQLEIVAATHELPKIIDALARRNFITVTNVALRPADPFAAAREGFLYGAEPVSEVELTLEIIQLREWTTLRMPDEMKVRIGTLVTTAPDGAATDGSAGVPMGDEGSGDAAADPGAG